MLKDSEIVDFLERYYSKPLPKLRELFDRWAYEYFSIRASIIGEHPLIDIIRSAREIYDNDNDIHEFFYDRQSGLVISGVHYHNDIADTLYSELYPEYEDEFMPDYAFEELQTYGFMSRVGSRSFRFEFSLNYQEKQFFKDYI